MHPCLVVRHAAAEHAASPGLDAERELSAEGAATLARVAAGLAAAAPAPALSLTSPYARARQTAAAVAAAFGGVEVTEEPTLAAGGTPADILAALVAHCRGDAGGIAVIGHEPDLGRFASYGLAGTSRSFLSLRKGGACLLEFPALPRAGNAPLVWALDPEHLEALGARARRRDDATA
ncbi:MAG: histidine phosphatase family protein [Halofilum sp. (in: g-proteobacteria)]|nr:histidine phosphatase family protein [Halofilum sp. (in: g-proteobacteria)]